MRALETSVSSADRLNALSGWTDKFLFPPHDFKIANVLISNFHPPESTLLMATAAFAGFEILEEAYNEAIKKKYRFLAYGDAMIII
jgi:S-adenosylmethionine:tRNA ribosyltransferase-isomerase